MELNVRAILFDIDGTLVDSTAAVERTWQAFADAHGLDVAAILATSHGRRSEDVVPEHLPAGEVEAGLRFLAACEIDDRDGIVALPGTRELLARLPEPRWAAVTSGGRAVMVPRLETAGLPVPAVLISADDVTAGKPDPEGYLAAASALGIDPRDCLVIEDAPAGVAAGLAAGAHVLAVATSHPADQLGRADAVVPDLTACTFTVTDDAIEVVVPGQRFW